MVAFTGKTLPVENQHPLARRDHGRLPVDTAEHSATSGTIRMIIGAKRRGSTGAASIHSFRRTLPFGSPRPDRRRMDDVVLPPAYLWQEAVELGARRRQIEAAGRRLGKGLYLAHAEEGTLAVRCRAWARVLPSDAVFGLETAAALYGVELPAVPDDVQVVLRPRPVMPRRQGLAVHERGLTAADVAQVDGVPVTTGAQTWLDLVPRLPPAELLAAGDALLRKNALTSDGLAERLGRAHRVRGVVRGRELAPLLDRRAQSRQESLLRYWLLASDLPEPELQCPVHDRFGREVAHADLGWPTWKVCVEYEGRQHADLQQFGRDIDRYSLMAADGWLTLRFAARHVHTPWVVVDRSRRALQSRGWR
jgi:very-short-patch-repair endonuclease